MFTHDPQSTSEARMSDYASEARRRQTLSAVQHPRREQKMVQPWTVRWIFDRVVRFPSEHRGPRFVRGTGFRGMYRGSFDNTNR
jgi:hypothetical protein